ncbi:MAG: nucleotidyltransferase domain-containing protein [Verrucomicrobiota bacterium]|nr:nucleotidyltransferase domain-containing protein [Verrucomicrobiota bacterium]
MTSSKEIKSSIKQILFKYPQVTLCFVYGSLVKGNFTVTSDIDIAIGGKEKMDYSFMLKLSSELSLTLGREVDLIDLQIVSGVILKKAVTTDRPLFLKDKQLYAQLIKKMWYNQADMMPYYNRILKERREKFLNE